MKNADLPIYPVQDFKEAVCIEEGGQITRCIALDIEANGLTKREYFAGLAMQGFLMYPRMFNGAKYEWVAKEAIQYADELLKELEKEQMEHF